MATTHDAAAGDVDPPGGEFFQLLYRGGELLAAGNIEEARDQLERAHGLQPENEKGKNLLGLTYFKLGLFERAAQLYEALVQENPADPTLRVNLGLVYLKNDALPRAIHEFATATDLAPDHAKAHSYLGLALAQTGQYAKAREHFLLAGSQAMADKMALALAEGGEPDMEQGIEAAQGEAGIGDSLAPEMGAESEIGWNEEPGAKPDSAAAPQENGAPVYDEEMRFADDEGPTLTQYEHPSAASSEPHLGSAPPAPVAIHRWASASPTPIRDGLVSGALADLVSSLQVAGHAQTVPFEMQPGLVLITVQNEILTRLSGLVAYSGALDFKPERKRFRGRVTDRCFGEGGSQMVRAHGHGALWLDPKKEVFVATHLGGEPAYFREDTVFAIEEPVLFENGRLPSDVAPDLDLVYVRGQGSILLALPSAPRSIEVSGGRPVTVPLDNLVGWYGNLTPRISIIAFDDSGKVIRAGVELSGAGYVLFTHPLS